MFQFLSGKIKKTTPSNVSENRYKYISLEETEPDLGVAPANNSILASNTIGGRYWLSTNNSFVVSNGQLVIANNAVVLGVNTTGNYVANVSGSDGVTITGGDVEGANITVVNSDKGSSQNIFKNIANSVGDVQFSANTNSDTIRFAGGGNTAVSFDSITNTITITTVVPNEADTLQVVTERGATTNQSISFTSSEASSNSSIGAVTVTGGVGVGGALNVAGNITTDSGVLSTSATSASLFNTDVLTLNIGSGANTISIGSSTGYTTINNGLIVSGNLVVQGESTSVNTQILVVEDKNIELGNTTNPSNITANGGGISLLAGVDGDKTWSWISSTTAWTSSEHINLVSGKEYRIGNALVANSTSLGSSVVLSSLTTLGTITSGLWNGSVIGTTWGGTGQSTYSNGQILIGNASGSLTKATITQGNNIVITNGDGAITISVTGLVQDTDRISNTEIANTNHVTGKLITGQAFVYGINTLTTLQEVTGRGNTTTNPIIINNTSDSANTTTGAIVVSGGVAANVVYVGSEIRDGVTATSSKIVPIATTSPTAVDSFNITTYRSGRYILQITQGSNYQVSEFRILHNGTNTFITEYAVLETGTSLCTFTADVNSSTARIIATMTNNAAATIKINRVLITV